MPLLISQLFAIKKTNLKFERQQGNAPSPRVTMVKNDVSLASMNTKISLDVMEGSFATARGSEPARDRPVLVIQKEPFDYTKWQENLFKDMTIDEIYNNAAELRQKNKMA